MTPVLPESAPATSRVLLPFDPARDGFSFANSFTWTDADLGHLSKRLRPVTAAALAALGGGTGALAGRKTGATGAVAGGVLGGLGLGDGLVRTVAQRWKTFGLCGGMSLAALERWEARSPTPTSALRQDAMRPLLRRRQAETLRRSLSRFVYEWAVARWDGTEHPPLGGRLVREVALARRRIEGGHPVILGLVGDSPDPFANHQVVAYGIELGDGPAEATFFVYDPNAPGVTRHVRTGLATHDRQRTAIWTDLPTGRRASGHCHLSTRPNWLASVFVVM